MAHRKFTDAARVIWDAWDTYPKEHGVAAGALHVAQELRHGWLTFESSTEKRRLAPVPPEWATLSDAELEALCRKARQTRPTRISPPKGTIGH